MAAGVCAFAACEAAAQSGSPVACVGVRPAPPPVASHHATSLAKLDAIAPPDLGTIAVRSGPWSDAATWGGQLPTSRAVIPNGVSVVFDQRQSNPLKSVRIEGCLELSSATPTRLNAEFVYVAPRGELLAGTPTSPVPSNIAAQIIFPDFGPLDVVTDPTLLGKGLVSASRVRLYGSLKTARMKVAAAPMSGDSVIRLEAPPVGWNVGDRIVLTGTKFIPQKVSNGVVISSPSEDERRVIMAINGATITLDKPLAFAHGSPSRVLAAYVVNYSRNIRLATFGGAAMPNSQRAHSMFMTWDTALNAVEFFEMGRTDKSVRAVDAGALANPTPTSNVKGRYPLHLHQVGFPADKFAPVIRGVAVWGSPGWGVAQHNSKAFLYQNNTWNTFGAGFVSESGNETGAWVENTAVRGVGVAHIVKDGGDVSAFDLGRTGDGFWLQSRSVRLVRNVAAGMTGGIGFVYFHRANDLETNFPLTPGFIDKTLCAPAAFRFESQRIEKPSIAQFLENEAIASKIGFHVVKTSPKEPHDIRSVLDRFTAWEVVRGVDLTYTSRYTIKNAVLFGAADAAGSIGVHFGVNTYDMALVDSTIVQFDWGVNLAKTLTADFTPSTEYVVSGVVFSGLKSGKFINRDSTDKVFSTSPSHVRPQLAFSFGADPLLLTDPGNELFITGVKSDSFGQVRYPIATKEFRIRRANFLSLAEARGWQKLPTGEKVVVVPEFFSDRLTGELVQSTFAVRLGSKFPWPTQRTDGSPGYQGRHDPASSPPALQDDAFVVSADATSFIGVKANDSSLDGALIPSGYTHASYGNVFQRKDGEFEYTPYPDFKGADSFTYWMRDRQGHVSRARVNIAVQ